MKCFSSQLVRKFLILSAAMMVLINLLCMWKVSDQIEKEKEKKLEAKLTIKLKKGQPLVLNKYLAFEGSNLIGSAAYLSRTA